MYLFLLGRILFGGFFFISGIGHMKNIKMMSGYAGSKEVPMPTTAVFLTGLLLLLGGAGVILGIYVQFALACLALFLLGVTYKMHDFWNVQDPMQKMAQEINFKKNAALLGAVFMLLMVPLPWVLSLF